MVFGIYSQSFSHEIFQFLVTFYVKTISGLAYFIDTIQVAANSYLRFPKKADEMDVVLIFLVFNEFCSQTP